MPGSDQQKQHFVTLSFYKYARIGNPILFRDHLMTEWQKLGITGRTYVAHEGINAQISVPEEQFDAFKAQLDTITFLRGVRLNVAIEPDARSFKKLRIKVRPKIVADGLDDRTFDVTKGGRHVAAQAFNRLADDPDTVIVDMRNHYESEVGHFKGALLPDADTFREELPLVEQLLQGKEDKNLLMYCTGGIRCEKASAWFRHKGFKKVYQLDGGIIEYARQVRQKGLENKFIGKNFVFDDRLGERITDDVIARCHQCGQPCDHQVNCKNVTCNLLFIQCDACAEKYEGCCSDTCRDFIHLPEEKQAALRKGQDSGIRIFTKGRSDRLPYRSAAFDRPGKIVNRPDC